MTALLKVKSWLTLPRREAASMSRMFQAISEVLYTKPCLLNTFFGLEAPRPLLPNIFVTGSTAPRLSGGVQETALPSLNAWIDWVRAEGLRIVYVSMGSMQVLKDFQVR